MRKITSDGKSVTAVNRADAQIDARAWLYTVDEDGEERNVVIQVTGQAAAEKRRATETALASRGRSVLEEVVASDAALPRRVMLLTDGRRDILD